MNDKSQPCQNFKTQNVKNRENATKPSMLIILSAGTPSVITKLLEINS